MNMFFFKGLGIGFTIAAIIGPISLLCIRSTLTQGQAVGLAIGLGASLADAVYGMVAGFGLTFIADFLLDHQMILHIIGGSFLLLLGIKTLRSNPPTEQAHINKKGLLNTVIGTFFLTLTNPVTIVSFMALFAGLGVGTNGTSYITPVLLVSGIFVGAMVWWIILTSFLRLFHAHMNQKTIALINKCSGAIIIGFGIILLASVAVTIKI